MKLRCAYCLDGYEKLSVCMLSLGFKPTLDETIVYIFLLSFFLDTL